MKSTFRFTPSWWLLVPSAGLLTVLMGIGALIKNYPDAVAGKLTILDYLALGTLIPLMIGFGILCILTLLSSKIVVSSSGLEYHALAGIYSSSWQSLRSAGKVAQGGAGSAAILYSLQPVIIIKKWARWLPWNVGQGIAARGIPVSWFGGIRGGKLKLEIEAYAPHLLEKL